MDYTYIVPKNLQQQLVATLRVNGHNDLSDLLQTVVVEFTDVGLAYYAGMRGDTWDKHALDCSMFIPEKDIETISQYKLLIKSWMQKMLPGSSGLLVREITFIPKLGDLDVDLPEINGDTWDVLYSDITQALSRNEPSLVLDRLHTFSVKFIRALCEEKCVNTLDDKGRQQPLHSLVGMLTKHYQKNDVFESDFSEQAMKMSISLFDKYNGIRNDQSYAHDNEILNKAEAMFAVKIMTATISFIHELEEL